MKKEIRNTTLPKRHQHLLGLFPSESSYDGNETHQGAWYTNKITSKSFQPTLNSSHDIAARFQFAFSNSHHHSQQSQHHPYTVLPTITANIRHRHVNAQANDSNFGLHGMTNGHNHNHHNG